MGCLLAVGVSLSLPRIALAEPAELEVLRKALDAEIARRELQSIPDPPAVRPALRELGRLLNFDPILSGNRNIACASCHDPTMGTGDARHLPRGTGAQGLGTLRGGGGIVPRNAPSLFNLHAYRSIFWDNRIEIVDGELFTPAGTQLTPEMREVMEFGLVSAQAMFPVTSHTEMAGQPGDNPIADATSNTEIWQRLITRVLEIPEYRDRLQLAYPGEHTFRFAHVANAIAAFQVSAYAQPNTPWQRYLKGEKSALNAAQLQGALTFFETGCANCHSGPLFSDFAPHNSGLAQVGPGKGVGQDEQEDWGRWLITGNAEDKHRFRTAPLVNIEQTGPWGHAGQFASLRSYLEHYQNPKAALMAYDTMDHIYAYEPELWFFIHPEPSEIAETLDPKITELKPFAVDEILDFFSALTDPGTEELIHEIPRTVPSGLKMDPFPAPPKTCGSPR